MSIRPSERPIAREGERADVVERQGDDKWMAMALEKGAAGTPSPNPHVGAVIVKGAQVVGSGHHERAGEDHAEITALREAGNRAKGATLYVTLEPCSTHGRTPPCTEAIIAAGIKHLVVGATDPNPRHRGRAFKILRRAGIMVTPGILADECARLNESFNQSGQFGLGL